MNVISAAICIPQCLTFEDGTWALETRRGSSALYDALQYLSTESKPSRQHTLVGWTGEIKPPKELLGPPTSRNGWPTSTSQANSMTNGNSTHEFLSYLAQNSHNHKHDLHAGAVRLSVADRKNLEAQLLQDNRMRTVPVWLYDCQSEDNDSLVLADQGRWRRFAEREIYNTFHYKAAEPTDGFTQLKQWEDYSRMNEKFVEKILEIHEPGDIVWVHDYHLMLVPRILRKRRPDIYVGFFLHIPFPSSEYVKCIAKRKELLLGVLGSNYIGFQHPEYCRHFASCCIRLLGFDATSSGVDAHGSHIAVGAIPLGINASETEKYAFGEKSVDEYVNWVRQQHPGQKIIVGRDRLDTVRGVVQKLQAFKYFLEHYPEWRGKVLLVQITSETNIKEEKEDEGHKIQHKVSELVEKINGTYGNLVYTPVMHFLKYLNKAHYFALLRTADAGLITSIREGMNTTSLEYVICQKDKKAPLILSEFSATAASLQDALIVNPWDSKGVAAAINDALTMNSTEKARREESLYSLTTTETVQKWVATYLERLQSTQAAANAAVSTPLLDRRKLLARYKRAKRRLFLFDYDGTLTPIVREPAAAVPSDRILRTIKSLAKDPKNAVWVVSGRDQAFLGQYMGYMPDVGLSAEHGCFLRPPNAADPNAWTNLAATTDMSWQPAVLRVFEEFADRTPGSFVERKRVALTWHFRRVDPEFAKFRAEGCRKKLEEGVLKDYDLEVMNGKANLEVRPRFLNKGVIADRLVREFGDAGPDFVFCAGDDNTDEDMFGALQQSGLPEEQVFTVTVSARSKKTLAQWCLLEPPEVIATVAMLNGAVTAEDIEAASGLEKLKF